MKIISTFLLGSTLAIGAVVGMAPAGHAAPIAPVGPTVTINPGIPPINPCLVKVCKPPVIKVDPCIFNPEICAPTPDPGDDPKPEDPQPEEPKDPGTPPANVDVPVKGKPVFTG